VPGSRPIALLDYYPEFIDYYPTCELQTKRWIVENVGTDWVCLDVGAHIGYHSILMARMALNGHVYSFEPTESAQKFQTNLEASGEQNVTLIRKAVSNFSGSRVEPIYRIWGNPPERISRDFVTIDEFVESEELDRLDFLKIDVDGFDFEALQGAVATLARFSPTVLVEINHALATRGFTASDVTNFMLEMKYGRCLVVDKDNYIFEKSWTLGDPWPRSLILEFDRRGANTGLKYSPNGEQKMIPFLEWTSHNHSLGLPPVTTAISGPAWSYALSADVSSLKDPDGKAIVLRLRVIKGSTGVFLSDSECTEMLTNEVVSGVGEHIITLPLAGPEVSRFVIRKISGEYTEFLVEKVYVAGLQVAVEAEVEVNLDQLNSRELASLLDTDIGADWTSPRPLSGLDSWSIEEFAAALGFVERPPELHNRSDPSSHLMERDDAPFFAWLYSVLKPKKHLEIGTWEGFGTLLCLKFCDADVWTINLPDGEKDALGDAIYSTSREPYHREKPRQISPESDVGSQIGWMFRVAGFSKRVHQIFADSQTITPNQLPDSFDSVLIDGGHKREVVASDIRLALSVVSPQGIVLVHDFSVRSTIIEHQKSTRGVLAAVADLYMSISESRRLIWIENTTILAIVPK